MPLRGDRSPAEERAEPASTLFSPVARDYPSRALNEPFQAAALRLFYQGTGATMTGSGDLESSCSPQLFHRRKR